MKFSARSHDRESNLTKPNQITKQMLYIEIQLKLNDLTFVKSISLKSKQYIIYHLMIMKYVHCFSSKAKEHINCCNHFEMIYLQVVSKLANLEVKCET